MYVVVNIGCIECGVSSNVVGIFNTQREADIVASLCYEKLDRREGGQNKFEVFKLPEVGVLNIEYAEALCIESDTDGLYRFKLST